GRALLRCPHHRHEGGAGRRRLRVPVRPGSGPARARQGTPGGLDPTAGGRASLLASARRRDQLVHAGGCMTTPAVTITPMRRRHLSAVSAIEAQSYPTPWSARLFEDEMERRGRHYVVARIGPTVVGYAGLLMIADDGHVSTVAVDPARRGEQIAT